MNDGASGLEPRPPLPPGRNNFDLLRLLFALMVCLVHVRELSGNAAFAFMPPVMSALAVKGFFVVSGFLIFMSYERAPSLRDYASRRIRRIYPAYLLVVAICALVLPWLCSAGGPAYFSAGWLKYVVYNAVFLNFLQPTLPGVFEGLRLQAVNGALWTLKIEVMFYVAVPLIAWLMNRLHRGAVLATIYLLSLAYSAVLTRMGAEAGQPIYAELARQLPGQLSYFMAGAVFYYFFLSLRPHLAWLAIGSLAILLAADRFPALLWAEPLALGAVVIAMAYIGDWGRFARYGDFSYGLYVTHFPIIQALLWWGVFRADPLYFLLTVLALVALAAAVSWHGVEKHFIARRPRQRVSGRIDAPS